MTTVTKIMSGIFEVVSEKTAVIGFEWSAKIAQIDW
jgi:hypothetical protein